MRHYELTVQEGGRLRLYSHRKEQEDHDALDNLFRVLSLEAELDGLSLDATIVQAHSVGAKKGLQTKLNTAREKPAQKSTQQ